MLEKAGITVLTDEKDVSKDDDPEEGVILEQDVEPGTKLGEGDTITLTIPNIYISYPNFTDGTYTKDDVQKFCDENGLTLHVTEVQDLQSENGAIVYQNMAAGSKVSEGANLRIKVVKNPEVPTTPESTDTGDTE